jgi:hypothetical protein
LLILAILFRPFDLISLLNYLVFQYIQFWWRLFQICVVHTKLIYVFIALHNSIMGKKELPSRTSLGCRMGWILNVSCYFKKIIHFNNNGHFKWWNTQKRPQSFCKWLTSHLTPWWSQNHKALLWWTHIL